MEIETKTALAVDAGSVAEDTKTMTPHLTTLRRVPNKLPRIALLILVVELGERFTYFGLSGPFQNYIK